MDATTEVVVDLGNDFSDLTYDAKLKRIANKIDKKEVAKKIFQDKKYAYTWDGNILSTLGFQIQEQRPTGLNNILLFWQISKKLPAIIKNLNEIRNQNRKLQALVSKEELLPNDKKNFSQVAIDPIGMGGKMPARFFYTNLHLIHTSDKTSPESYFPSSFNAYIEDGLFDWGNRQDQDWKHQTQNVSAYNSFIDGKNPGTIVLKMFNGQAMSNITQSLAVDYSLKTFSTKNRIQTFYKITNKTKIKQIAHLVFKFVEFLKRQIIKKTPEISQMLKIISPVAKSMFEFIVDNEITQEKIEKEVNRINNGSHYMLEVEIFLRGMVNIPDRLLTNFQIPQVIKLWLSFQGDNFKRKKNEIVGMVNVNNIIPILHLSYSASKPKAPKKSYNFHPQTTNYVEPYQDPITHFISDLSKIRKWGKN